MSPLATTIEQQLKATATPEKAVQMQAYMKTTQPFYGIQAKPRMDVVKKALKTHPLDKFDDYINAIQALWQAPHREDMYAAMDVMEFAIKYKTNAIIPQLESMMGDATNWDLIDRLAGKIFKDLLKADRSLESKIIEWREHKNMWFRRSALIAQLCHHQATNKELLAETILMLNHEKGFFIRKAIGWALRDYSKSNPDWVKNFIDKHKNKLAPLSVREGMKVINRKS